FYPSRCMPFRNIYFYFRFGCLLSNSKEVSVLSFMTIRALNLLPELLFMPLIRLVFPLVTRLSISSRRNSTPHTVRNLSQPQALSGHFTTLFHTNSRWFLHLGQVSTGSFLWQCPCPKVPV